MCVIAVYRNGKRPTTDDLAAMIKANGDGCGVAWNNGKKITFVKGLKTAEAVQRIITDADHHGARDIVFHARIATSGGVSAHKCHPFLISQTESDLNRVYYRGKGAALFHNGILDIIPARGLNDTQTFIRDIFADYWKHRDAWTAAEKQLLRMAISGSRVAIITPSEVLTDGEGWTTRDGVMYSNLTWLWRGWYDNYYDDDGFVYDKERKAWIRQ